MSCARPNTPRSNPKDLGELERPLRDRLWTMFQDAPAKGLTLVSGYRDPGRQWDLRHDRCPGRECDSGCKGHPTTALPGRSNHGKRKAADVGGRDLRWFVANVHRYGLHLPVPGENWHAEVAGTPTVRILSYPGPAYDQTVLPPAPRPFRTFAKNATDAGIYAKGGQPTQVSDLQRLLGAKQDGIYGPKTVAAVVAFKTKAAWTTADGKKNDRTSTVDARFFDALRNLGKH